MNSRIKKLISRFIAYSPITASSRALLYKSLGYRIGKGVKIGYGAVIDCDIFSIGNNSSIGKGVKISGLHTFILGYDCLIDQNVNILGPRRYLWGETSPTFIAGNNVAVMAYWTIDVTKTIEIGDNVLFAGRYGQVYSHTFDLMNNRLDFCIEIGSNVYIGSSTCICGQICITDNVVITLGSIITHSILEEGVYGNVNNIQKIGDIHNFSELYYDGKQIDKKVIRAQQYTIYDFNNKIDK